MDGERHPIETINDAIEIGEIKEVIECARGLRRYGSRN